MAQQVQQVQGQFGYQTTQLIKTEPLGSGSYGAVYKARCDDLICAGKILHSTFFQSNDPGAIVTMRRFEQECHFLNEIRHPNIVQYLGSCIDRETGLPILLMELMDESLTQFLKQSQQPILYHTQVDLCHDVALALSYLHTNHIIHRDLSSNNVLLSGAENKAKITDFGMAKFVDMCRTTATPMTMCPGTQAYMSPEALDDPPEYTKKLDSFSFGVLGIQIITQLFPDPSPRLKKLPHANDTIRVLVPENERRKTHIDMIRRDHPLLPIATDCLKDNEKDRPSAQDLCDRIAELKISPQYGSSVTIREDGLQNQLQERERQIRELQQQQQECNEQIQYLQHQLQVKDGQLQEQNQQLAASQQVLTQKEKMIQELCE